MEAVPIVAREQGLVAEAVGVARQRPWLLSFAALHLACQLLLLVPELSALRIVVRIATFGTGLAFLFIIPGKSRTRVVVRPYAFCILGIMGIEFFHPDGSGSVAGLAAVMLTLAVLAPIFWVPRAGVTPAMFQRLVTVLWLFYTASSILGVLQTYFPGRFQPPLSAVYLAHGREVVNSLRIQLVSGERTYRPMGLTDVPGGAAYAGLYAILLGAGVILLPKPPFRGARVLAFGSMIAGMMCLYLCQVRSLVVMVGVCVVTLLAVLLVSGRVSRLLGAVTALGVIVPLAFMLAVSLGGQSMINRLATLVNSDPGTVYYQHRGHFLETTVNEYLPRYPLGAGLGRWGMVYHYFGDRTFGETTGTLWAEIQWTAWLFDGGIPLILAYVSAIGVVSWACFRIAVGQSGRRDPTLSLWGAVLVAYNVGTLAVCFDFAVFAATAGVEFWLINVALLCAAQNSEGPPRSRRLSV